MEAEVRIQNEVKRVMKISCDDCHLKLKEGNFFQDEAGTRIHRQCSGSDLLRRPSRSERERRYLSRDAVGAIFPT